MDVVLFCAAIAVKIRNDIRVIEIPLSFSAWQSVCVVVIFVCVCGIRTTGPLNINIIFFYYRKTNPSETGEIASRI